MSLKGLAVGAINTAVTNWQSVGNVSPPTIKHMNFDTMSIYAWFGVSIFVIVLLAVLVGLGLNKKISKKTFLIWALLGLGSLTLMAFLTNPYPRQDDLFRYFGNLWSMDQYGWSYVNTAAEFRTTPVINYLFYIVSLTHIYGFLPAIIVLTVYGIIIYITYNFTFKKEKSTYQVISLYFLLILGLCPVRFTVSGIRNQLAYSFMFLGIYLSEMSTKKTKKKYIIAIILYILAAMSHPASFIIIGIVVVAMFKRLYKFRFLLLITTFVALPILELLSETGISAFVFVHQKLSMYFFSATISLKLQAVYFIVIAILYIIFIRVKQSYLGTRAKRKESFNLLKNDALYLKYPIYFRIYEYMLLLALGNIVVGTLFQRLCIIIGMMSLPILLSYSKIEDKYKKYLYTALLIILLGLFVYFVKDAWVNWIFYS